MAVGAACTPGPPAPGQPKSCGTGEHCDPFTNTCKANGAGPRGPGVCDPPCQAGERCQPTQDGGQCVSQSSPGPQQPGGQQCGPVPNTNPPVPRMWDQGRQRCVPNCGGGQGYDGKLKKCRGCQPGE